MAMGVRGRVVGRSVVSESESMPIEVTRDEDRFARLLREMRKRSNLTTKELASRLSVTPGSIAQYFYRKRGVGGTSTLRWFLRFASACGCRVYVTYPSREVVAGLRERPMEGAVLREVSGE
jgi:transcriptional regulator with XRE-family HTH domain